MIVEGKFRHELLEEIEIVLDTKKLLDNLTDQVKSSIKKAIALLVSVSTEPTSTDTTLHPSNVEKSAENDKGNHLTGMIIYLFIVNIKWNISKSV